MSRVVKVFVMFAYSSLCNCLQVENCCVRQFKAFSAKIIFLCLCQAYECCEAHTSGPIGHVMNFIPRVVCKCRIPLYGYLTSLFSFSLSHSLSPALSRTPPSPSSFCALVQTSPRTICFLSKWKLNFSFKKKYGNKHNAHKMRKLTTWKSWLDCVFSQSIVKGKYNTVIYSEGGGGGMWGGSKGGGGRGVPT